MNSLSARCASPCFASAVLAALVSCSSGALIDQAHYELPDARGIQVTQVLLRGADEEATPDELDCVGYNRYARSSVEEAPRSILVLIPEWGRGAGWLDALARDLVAAEGDLEVWTLNRRQALLAAIGAPSDELAFLRRWDLALAERDLAVVCDRVRETGARLLLGGWGFVGGLQAYGMRDAEGADGNASSAPLFLFDTWLFPRNDGERATLEGLRAAARAQLDAGALTAVGLDPRVRPSTPGDFGFVEQAAFEAERAPEAESELVDRHPALRSAKRRFTNRGLFAWAFDRPRPRRAADALAQRGPLAGLHGIAFAELERGEDESGALDDALCGSACGAPYELEEALAPFSAPGGPFEAFAPLIGWIDALETLAGMQPNDEPHRAPVLWVESATQRTFRERASRNAKANTEISPSPFGANDVRQLALEGDEVAPLLAAEVRAQLVEALREWIAER